MKVALNLKEYDTKVIPLDGGSSSQSLTLKRYEIIQTLLNITEEIHGEFGAAAVRNGLDVKYLDENTKIIIIRSRHGPHRLLASSLPFLSKIGKRKIQLQGVYTGASMVQCFKFLKKYHQEKLNEALKSRSTEKEKKKVIEIMSNIKFEQT